MIAGDREGDKDVLQGNQGQWGIPGKAPRSELIRGRTFLRRMASGICMRRPRLGRGYAEVCRYALLQRYMVVCVDICDMVLG